MHRQTIAAYDRAAEHWRRTRVEGGRKELATGAAESFRTLVGAGLVLDLGCGPAALLEALGSPAIGVDASMGMLALTPETARGSLVCGDLEALPLADGVAAAAFGSFSFQHLPKAGFARALDEVRRVLRPGGYVQLAMHQGEYEGDDRPNDDMPGRWFTYWTPEPLRAAFAGAGFEVVDVADEVIALRVTARR